MKKIIALALVLVMALSLVACGGFTAEKTITIAASATPHAEILAVAKKVLAKDGWKLEIVEYADNVVPNTAVDNGEMDANYFQHQPDLDTFNAEHGTQLVSVASIHYEPFGIYPGTKSHVEELVEDDQVAIPNDGSNRVCALRLLEAKGLIKLDDGVGMQATVLDIVENPLHLEIVEMEAAQIAGIRDSVALAVISGNDALLAGLNVTTDAIAFEDAASVAAQTYANILVVKVGNENTEKIRALKAALMSAEVRTFINDTYNGTVVPLF